MSCYYSMWCTGSFGSAARACRIRKTDQQNATRLIHSTRSLSGINSWLMNWAMGHSYRAKGKTLS